MEANQLHNGTLSSVERNVARVSVGLFLIQRPDQAGFDGVSDYN